MIWRAGMQNLRIWKADYSCWCSYIATFLKYSFAGIGE